MQPQLIQGISGCAEFFQTRGLFSLAETHLKRAELVARETDDNSDLITVLLHLGRNSERTGNYELAERCLIEGLALARQFGEQTKESRVYAPVRRFGEQGISLRRRHTVLAGRFTTRPETK